jgi:O-antigen/teichoic acid export membrane protein
MDQDVRRSNLRPPRGKSRFVSNSAALGTSAVITTLFTLAQVKILAAFLAPEAFGLFAALRGFSLLVALLAANGFPQLLVRFLPRHEAKKQLASALVLSGVCFFVPLFLLTVFVFVIEANRSFFFDVVPAGWLENSGGAAGAAGLFVWFYATTLGVTLKLILYGGLNGLRRLPAQVILELVSLAVQVAWIYAWRDQLTLARLFMVLGVTSLATCAAGLPWYFIRLSHDVSPAAGTSPGRDGTAEGTSVGYREYWLGATGLSLVAVAFTDVDRYVLSQVLALEILSQFHIGSRILRLANRFLSVPVLAFQPEVTRLDAERRHESIAASTKVFFKFNSAVATAVMFALWALAPEMVRLVSNAQYEPAVPLLRILVISIPLTAMTAPMTTVMKALDQVGRALYCDLAWAVTYIALLLLLGGAYGLAGAGVAQVSASLAQLTLAMTLGRLKFGPGFAPVVISKSVLSALVAFAPLLGAGALLSMSPATLLVKAVLFAAALVIFRAMIRVTGVFDPHEREALIALMTKRGAGRFARWIV